LQQRCCSVSEHYDHGSLFSAWHGACVERGECPSDLHHHIYIKETVMQWSKPEFTDFRFGFEITMYIFNR